jgi:hypothetical protein
MTRSALGEPAELTAGSKNDLLSDDWYQFLTSTQKIAYIRYQYISLNECVHDWDARAHVKRRPAWDGGKDNYGVKHTPVWGKILRAAETAHAHLGLWVHAHFSALATERITTGNQRLTEMRPATLYSAKSAEIYRDYVAHMPRIIKDRFHVAAETLKLRIATTAIYKMPVAAQELYVLCDESYVTATPFFRNAFAARSNCEKAVERYLWKAALDYEAQQRSYDAVMAAHPEYSWWTENDIKRGVVEIRQHWRNYDAD